MASRTGRCAVVTGGGQGLGRAYALALAERGAKVLVSSVAAGADGRTSADRVVEEIKSAGGEAAAHRGDLSGWSEAGRLVDHAVEAFGGLDVVVNNAGVLQDRTLANMSEAEWDTVLDVHLKGQAATLHWAAAYWRDESKQSGPLDAAVVNTTAGAGLFGNVGQANYAAAKAGVVGLTLVAARELGRYGVRVNAVAPFARTRLTDSMPGIHAGTEGTTRAFDRYAAGNVAPLVCYLAEPGCPFTGQVFNVQGGEVVLYDGWKAGLRVIRDRQWTVEELQAALADWPPGPPPFAPPRLEEPS